MGAIYAPDLLITLQSQLNADDTAIKLSDAEERLFNEVAGNEPTPFVPMIICDNVKREAVKLKKGDNGKFYLERFRQVKHGFPKGSVLKPIVEEGQLEAWFINSTLEQVNALVEEAKQARADAVAAIEAKLNEANIPDQVSALINHYFTENPITIPDTDIDAASVGNGEGNLLKSAIGRALRFRRIKNGGGLSVETVGDDVVLSVPAVQKNVPDFVSVSDGETDTIPLVYDVEVDKNRLITKSLNFDTSNFNVQDDNGVIRVSNKRSALYFGGQGYFSTTKPFSDDVTYEFDAATFDKDDVIMLTVNGIVGTNPDETNYTFSWKLQDGTVETIGSNFSGRHGAAMTQKPNTATKLRLRVNGNNLSTTVQSLPKITYFILKSD